MIASNNAPNVWTQMNYIPPRGQCNFKQSIVSAKCPCLRFMLHPLKSASSYECDGCGHHASFHSMENKEEDAVTKKWALEAKEKQEEEMGKGPRKRLRELEYANSRRIENGAVDSDDFEQALSSLLQSGKPKARKKAQPVARARGGTRARGKVTEIQDGDEDYIDLVD